MAAQANTRKNSANARIHSAIPLAPAFVDRPLAVSRSSAHVWRRFHPNLETEYKRTTCGDMLLPFASLEITIRPSARRFAGGGRFLY